jgi:hypothetical protein
MKIVGERRGETRRADGPGRRLRLTLIAIGVVAAAVGLTASSAMAAALYSEGFNSADVVAGTGLPAGWTSSANVPSDLHPPLASGNFWRDQINPQTISVSSALNPTLVTLPDSGALASPFEGNGAAWFGEPSTGTFCGADPAATPANSYTDVTQAAKNGCTSEGIEGGILASPPISMSSTPVTNGSLANLYPSAQLSFASWWDIEGVQGNAYDLMNVYYSIDGGTTWTEIGGLNPLNATGGASDTDYTSGGGLEVPPTWQSYLVDLAPAITAIQTANAGATPGDPTDSVRIGFAFDTQDALYNGFRGWMLDNVVVSNPYTGGTPAIASANPACALPNTATPVTLTGKNIPLGSTVLVDGSTSQSANTPASTKIEFTTPSDLAAGNHTLQIVTPSGTQSAAFNFPVTPTCGQLPPSVTPSAPTVTTNSVGLNASVNPNGNDTVVFFKYGLDPKYGLTTSSNLYTDQTAPQDIGAGMTPTPVMAAATGLVPNALYHYEVVATNQYGTTTSTDQTFTTAALAPPPPPVIGREANFSPVSGNVYVMVPPPTHAPIAVFQPSFSGHAIAALTKGVGFVPLTQARQLPVGTDVDSRAGTLKLTTATTAGNKPKTQVGQFSQGLFQVLQSSNRKKKGLTNLKLLDNGLFPGAPNYKTECATVGKTANGSRAFKPRHLSKKVVNTLLSNEHGNYTGSGKYSAATVRGTVFTIVDRCDATVTHVKRGEVAVTVYRRPKKQIILRTGQTYYAKAP